MEFGVTARYKLSRIPTFFKNTSVTLLVSLENFINLSRSPLH